MKSVLGKKIQLSVVTAHLDYDDNDITIDSVSRFDNSQDAAKYITDDYNESFDDMSEIELTDVLAKINTLKPGKAVEFDGPEDAPSLYKWKVFRH